MYDDESHGPSFGPNAHDFWSLARSGPAARARQNSFNAAHFHPSSYLGQNFNLRDVEVYTYADITG